nr:bifunctional shikimate kinase/3-dehydroquinate synthase [Acidimicrobiia bacterium]
MGHLVLVGMMGSGKTSVGELVAERLGRKLVDSDAVIEARTGRTVREIFEADGEAAFRTLESEALAEALASPQPAVVAAAGGVVLDEANRELLRSGGGRRVVWLDADPSVLAARVEKGDHRPLLGDDPEAAMVRLADGRAYPVVVGAGARTGLASLLPTGTRRAAVVTQPGIGFEVDPGCEHRGFLLGSGEEAKTLTTVESLCRAFSRFGLTRGDVVVAVGGGVVTDTAGFAAAVYHRGVAVVHVSTTLLGQVDAAIGGKTGVNLPEGKNLVGAFWQPAAVVCDLDALATLPEREQRSGRGEMAKYAFLGAPDLTELDLEAAVAACVRLKGEVVAGDERESVAGGAFGRRALLNYGHTLAHALEVDGAFDLRHGEAVAMGLVFAARLAERLGRIGADRVDEHRRVVASYGLSADVPPGRDPDRLLALMA